jgi:hypothetical protein
MGMKVIDHFKSILDALMSFIDGLGEGEEYGKEQVYIQEELNRVLPDDVVQLGELALPANKNF